MDDGPNRSALETKLTALAAVYHRYGTEGLTSYSVADASLLLTAKQIELRDAAKEKAEARLLEMEVHDLGLYVDSRRAAAGMPPRPRGTPKEAVDAGKKQGRGNGRGGR